MVCLRGVEMDLVVDPLAACVSALESRGLVKSASSTSAWVYFFMSHNIYIYISVLAFDYPFTQLHNLTLMSCLCYIRYT